MPQPAKDYLTVRAYEPGEFEAAQERLDELLRAFEPHLRPLLDRTQPPSVSLSSRSSIWLRPGGWLAEGWSRVQSRSAPARANAGVLAHLVLANWLASLAATELVEGKSCALNGDFLPGNLVCEEKLQSLPCEAYGVSPADVAQALRFFQAELVTAAAGAPVVLGPHLLLVEDPAWSAAPVRLFHCSMAAHAFAGRKAPEDSPFPMN